jgi:hypothetical protein
LKAKEVKMEKRKKKKKKKKKSVLNPKPYIPFITHLFGGQRTLEERNLSLPGNHCVWLE